MTSTVASAAAADRSQVYRAEALAPLPAWPVQLMIAWLPLWFLLGVAGFTWVIFPAFMAVSLIRRRHLVAPRGAGLWMLFLFAVAGSALSIENVPRLSGWVLRLGYYVGVTVFALYVLNGRSGLTVWKTVRAFTILWIATVAGGYLAFVFGDFGFASPMAYLMPAALKENELIATLVTPSFADLQDVIGFPVPRPKAPFPYTNSWGSMLGLLTPFALIAGRNAEKVGLSSKLIRITLYASLVPAVISLNRGLWLSAGVGFLYAAIRLGAAGQSRALRNLLIAAIVGAILLLATPLGGVIETRIETGHSNNDRMELAFDAIEGAIDRPLFGWGGPRPNDRNIPPVGTHGQTWFVMFSYGFIGFIGYFGSMILLTWRTRRQPNVDGLWLHVVLIIALVQSVYYLHVPHQMYTWLAAAMLALRMQRDPDVEEV